MNAKQLIQADYLQEADRLFGGLGLWMYRHKFVVFLVAIALLVTGAYFATKLRADNSLSSYFNPGDVAYHAYLEYQDEFGSDEVAYLLYSVPKSAHGPFDLDAMQRIATLTEDIEYEVPFVKEVTSLTNVEFITADGDFLEIHELALDMPEDQAGLVERGLAMMGKPSYRGSIIDDDALHGAIIIEMTKSSTDELDLLRLDPEGGNGIENLYPQVSAYKIEEILARPEYQDIEFRWSGDVPMNTAYNVIMGNESVTLSLLTLALVTVIALVCFRMQLLGVVGPLSVVVLGLVLTVGFMGLFGIKMSIMFLIAPTLIIAIGVAQSVHLITEFNILRSQGVDRKNAVKQALEHVAMPCLLAAVTTATGFMVMAGSELRALSELAVYLGAGVLLTFVASITVMVCLMSLGNPAPRVPSALGEGTRKKEDVLHRVLDKVATMNKRRPVALVLVFCGIIAGAVGGMGKLHVGFNFLDEFKPHVQFRQHTEYIQGVMGGMLNLVFIYDAGEAEGVKRQDVLAHLEEFQAYADQSPIVKKSYSLVDILKDINQSFHGDDPAYYHLPDSDELIAQYLLMYEISGGEELQDFLSGDYSQTTLELRVDITDSPRIAELVDELQVYLAENPVNMDVRATGMGLLWVKMAEYIATSQLWGYGLAFSIIALVLCLAYRSVKVGLLAMIPNLFPVVLALGLMGWQDIHLDYFRLLIATVAIGIAVDDTVHITSRMRSEFLRCGNYEQAIRRSLLTTGRALVVTTIVLTLSFLVFWVSDMEVLTSFGTLLALTMVAALIADLFFLPCLVLLLKPFGPESQPDSTANMADPAYSH